MGRSHSLHNSLRSTDVSLFGVKRRSEKICAVAKLATSRMVVAAKLVEAERSVAWTVANRLFFQKDFLTHNQVCGFVTLRWSTCLSIFTHECAVWRVRTVGRGPRWERSCIRSWTASPPSTTCDLWHWPPQYAPLALTRPSACNIMCAARARTCGGSGLRSPRRLRGSGYGRRISEPGCRSRQGSQPPTTFN